MLIESVELGKYPVAEVTLVPSTVPGVVVSLVGRRPLPLEEFLGDGSTGILGTDKLIHGVAIQRSGPGAAAIFQMMTETSGSSVGGLAKGALDVAAAVNARV
jgi:hypothetical protein